MAERDKPHLFVPNPPLSEPFTLSVSVVGGGAEPFSADRGGHGRRLKQELVQALTPESEVEESQGTYITFVSFPGLELALQSLDPQGRGEQPELVAVAEEENGDGLVQMATVYIPDGKKEYFLKRLDQYVETASNDKARHATLVEGIQSIRRATIRELWTDPQWLFPSVGGARHWWEVWLRGRDGNELERFTTYTQVHELLTSGHYLGFGDRTVLLLRASTEELAQTFESLDDIAELWRPHDVASLLTELSAAEQAEWVDQLRGRLHAAGADAPAVCVVDTGVQDGHPVLVGSLSASDIHVADPLWQKRPSHGHGTEMAGLALFGDLQGAIVGAHNVRLRHRLESVKFLPDSGVNERDLYGAITARSVDRPRTSIGALPRARVNQSIRRLPRGTRLVCRRPRRHCCRRSKVRQQGIR
jgi:hypothetical protein